MVKNSDELVTILNLIADVFEKKKISRIGLQILNNFNGFGTYSTILFNDKYIDSEKFNTALNRVSHLTSLSVVE